MHIIMRLLTAFIALGVWVPLIVAEDDGLSVEKAHGLTVKMAQAILDEHNELRAKEQASNMIRMEWNADIAQTAQEWANKCTLDHSNGGERNNHVSGYAYLGENLHGTSGKFIPLSAVRSWYSEISDYDYNSTKCASDKVCGHYTQVVWAESESLGCGAKYCPDNRFPNIFVCQYGPGGNYAGAKPYKSGETCSECPEKHSHCVKGLCSQTPVKEKEEEKKDGNEENDEESSKTRASNDGSLLRASYSVLILLSWATLPQIMH